MKIDEQLKNLKALNLSPDQFVVVSSGALAIRGIRDAKDLDVIVKEKLWDELKKRHDVTLNDWGIERIELGEIEILNPKQSIFGNSKIISFKDLFVKADRFRRINFMNLDHLKKIKKKLGRDVDLADIELINEYQSSLKEIRDEIESTYGFLTTLIIAFSVILGLLPESINSTSPFGELQSYILLVYIGMGYFLFKICGKRSESKPLIYLRRLLILNILFSLAPIGYFASYNHPSLITALSALLSLPFFFFIPLLLLTPFLYEFYLRYIKN